MFVYFDLEITVPLRQATLQMDLTEEGGDLGSDEPGISGVSRPGTCAM